MLDVPLLGKPSPETRRKQRMCLNLKYAIQTKKGKVKTKLLLWVSIAGTPCYPKNKRPDRPQSQSELSEKRKIFCLFQESNQGSLVIQPVFCKTK